MNEIRSHKAGNVAAVHVVAGTTVEAQMPLITLA
jgi:biotin carboxyl carrier protein